MNTMLSQVPEWGTAKRAKLEGIRTAARPAPFRPIATRWFVGFTGNYTAAVWMGNDGYAPTRRLTGGILPATIWNTLMTYAHTGIALKPIPFVDPEDAADKPEAEVADAAATTTETPAPAPGGVLTALTTTRLVQIERLFRSSPRLQPVADLGLPVPVTVAATPEAGEPPSTQAQ
jgi:penicillin-binding protein 1A